MSREEDIAIEAKKIKHQIEDDIRKFKEDNPGQDGYMYLRGLEVVISSEPPENEGDIIHVITD
jgi:hypothetical protein